MSRDLVQLPPIEHARGYSLQHAAMYLDCSLGTVYKLVHQGRLPSRTLGKKRIIPGSELIRFITGEEPVLKGDPIDPRMSELGRIGGRVGGLATARKHQAEKDAAPQEGAG